jgi:ketosteroid isomerase-like protein
MKQSKSRTRQTGVDQQRGVQPIVEKLVHALQTERRSFMRRFSCVSVVCIALLCLPALANAGTEEEVIAVTYAQWAANIAQDSEKAAAILADDYTQFNPSFPTRIDGKALNRRIADAMAEGGGHMLAGEMANAKVQVYGDVAILSYNFQGVNQDKDGATSPQLAKSTRVYVKQDGEWKLVHANFAPISADD